MPPLSIPADDRGLLLGDGLFETLLVVAGRPVFFEAHLARLVRGCAVLSLPPPEEPAVRQAMEQALAEAGLGAARAAVRITWTAGSGQRGLERPDRPQPRLIASAAPAAAPLSPAWLRTAQIRRNETSPASRLKTLAYLDNVLTRAEARTGGADEALMLNTRGEVACAAAANLFWIAGGALFTPTLSCGVLDGITRARVMDAAAALGLPAREVSAPRAALDAAEAIFLTSSLTGVRPVRRLDHRDLTGSDWTRRLAEEVAD